jgi:hypothetical protein
VSLLPFKGGVFLWLNKEGGRLRGWMKRGRHRALVYFLEAVGPAGFLFVRIGCFGTGPKDFGLRHLLLEKVVSAVDESSYISSGQILEMK